MKIILTSLLLFLFFTLHAQHKATIDVIIGADYSSRYLRNNNLDSVSSERFHREQDWNEGKIGYRFGINYNRPIARNWYLKTGIRLVQLGYNLHSNQTDLRWGSEWNPVTGMYERDPTLPHRLERFRYNYFFLEIPINGRYEFKAQKFTPYLEMGISPHIYLTTYSVTVTDIDKGTGWNRYKLNRTWSWVANAALGFNYAFNNHHQFFLQSSGRYHLNQLEKSNNKNAFRENFYTSGLETGLRFRL